MIAPWSEYITQTDFDFYSYADNITVVKETPKAIRLRLKSGLVIWMPKSVCKSFKVEKDKASGYFWTKIFLQNINSENNKKKKKQNEVEQAVQVPDVSTKFNR